jgi:hypothetical protein
VPEAARAAVAIPIRELIVSGSWKKKAGNWMFNASAGNLMKEANAYESKIIAVMILSRSALGK